MTPQRRATKIRWCAQRCSNAPYFVERPLSSGSFFLVVCRSLGLCWFLDAGNNETVRTLSSPASKKRQGTKSRSARHKARPGPDATPAPNGGLCLPLNQRIVGPYRQLVLDLRVSKSQRNRTRERAVARRGRRRSARRPFQLRPPRDLDRSLQPEPTASNASERGAPRPRAGRGSPPASETRVSRLRSGETVPVCCCIMRMPFSSSTDVNVRSSIAP